MSQPLWECTDEDGDRAWLYTMAPTDPRLTLRTHPRSAFLTPPAARSLRDALNAYLEETSTAEGWELP